MSIKGLAEAVIAQAMDDLSDDSERNDSINFFKSEGFRMCAETADMNFSGQITLLKIVSSIVYAAEKQKKAANAKRMHRRSGKYIHSTPKNRWGLTAAVK